MANQIRFKRASGSDPTASDLAIGEPGLRTDTAELFFKKDDGTIAKVSGGGGGPDFKYLALRNASNNGAASYPNANFTLVTSGTTNAITPAAANTLLVSVNGVIQKPNTGTSTPSSGFALSGSTIKFGANISAAPDFILYQESGGIGEPSDETVSEAKLKVSNSPVNGYFLSAQSGNTGGLTWAAPVATSCTGNSATATALATARAINGVNFDGTAAITVTAAAGTLSGTTLNSSVVTSSLTSLGDLTSLTVTGDLVVDTSTLKVDSSNNRVGIGTASPDAPLTIHNSSDPELRFGYNSSQDHRLRWDSSKVFLDADPDNSNSNSALGLNVDGSTKLYIDDAGLVGLSTTSPAAPLHVYNATNNTIARLESGDATARLHLKDNSGEAFVGATGDNLIFSNTSSATERVRIDSSGHILPGTDSQYNIGSNGVRFANGYFDTLYGDGSNLTGVSAGATGGGSDEIFYENDKTVTADYSITSGKNAMSAGPITIDDGVTVTVPSGSTYTIV